MRIRRFPCCPLWAWLPLVLVVTPSMAGEGWDGMIGAGAVQAPEYLGSDSYETGAWPAIRLTYGDLFYLSTRDGLGWNAIRREDWRGSLFLGYTRGRDNDDDLNRLDDVDGGATAGLRVVYRWS